MRQSIIFVLSLSIIIGNINLNISNEFFSVDLHDKLIENNYSSNDYIKLVERQSEVITFNYSECIEDCPRDNLIFNQEFNCDTLTLKIGSVNNCIAKFKIEHNIYNDTLELDIDVKGEIYKGEDGKAYERVIYNTCECYFYYDIIIKDVKSSPNTIIVNNRKLKFQK